MDVLSLRSPFQKPIGFLQDGNLIEKMKTAWIELETLTEAKELKLEFPQWKN